MTEERGLDEAHIFLVADALLTEATFALHNKRVKDLAEARRREAPDHFDVKPARRKNAKRP